MCEPENVCVFCRGELKASEETMFIPPPLNSSGKPLIVTNVPGLTCVLCKNTVRTPQTVKRLLAIVTGLGNGSLIRKQVLCDQVDFH